MATGLMLPTSALTLHYTIFTWLLVLVLYCIYTKCMILEDYTVQDRS